MEQIKKRNPTQIQNKQKRKTFRSTAQIKGKIVSFEFDFQAVRPKSTQLDWCPSTPFANVMKGVRPQTETRNPHSQSNDGENDSGRRRPVRPFVGGNGLFRGDLKLEAWKKTTEIEKKNKVNPTETICITTCGCWDFRVRGPSNCFWKTVDRKEKNVI